MHSEQSQQDDARILRILVVEDNLVNRKLAVALVQKWGYIALVANDGQEALTILAQEHVDLILMDVQMPVMDGLEATRAIRAQEAESGEHLPIVALTAHAYASDRARCMDAGMDEFLTKPVDHRDLHETILRLLPAGNGENPDVAVGSAQEEPVDPSAEPQFDRQEVLGRVDGDLDLLAEIAALFLDSCEAWLEDLRRSAASFGARSLVEAALRVEKIGTSLDLAEVDSAVRDLESNVGALTGELRSFLKEMAS